MSLKKKIIIAGGGTGGHVYPALAIAQALKTKNPNIEIIFIGTRQGHEARIIPQNQFPILFLPVSGLNQTSFLQKLITLAKIPTAFLKSIYILLRLRPDFVLGVGGYASGPFVLIAALMGFKTGLFESNAIPGLTNRWLSRFVDSCLTLFEESRSYFKNKNVIVTGFPVRHSMSLSPKKTSQQPLKVLVFGGSQGARGINTTVSQALLQFPKELAAFEFVHQTGKLDFSKISPLYKNHPQVRCLEYLDPMKTYYDWADIIFCRAGASTVSELAACGKAAVLIPFPFAADNHQQKNAESLVSKNAAEMILQKNFTAEVFKNKLLQLAQQPEILQKLELNIEKLNKPGAAERIADYIASQ